MEITGEVMTLKLVGEGSGKKTQNTVDNSLTHAQCVLCVRWNICYRCEMLQNRRIRADVNKKDEVMRQRSSLPNIYCYISRTDSIPIIITKNRFL